jgi:hypothetical protein
MLVAELLTDVVFAAALVAAVCSLAYLLYMTILERRLLAARTDSLRMRRIGASALSVSSPAPSSPAARDLWWRGSESPALPIGKR